MNVLITGKGTSGSWRIRGEQLGKALGARVEHMATPAGEDVSVCVKRVPDALPQSLRGIPIVWDVVDAYPQPEGNWWSQGECLRWLAKEVKRIRPAGIIAATKQMADDCKDFGVPVLWLPHHHRPGIERNPIRPEIRTIGYEGSPSYIQRWRRHIEAECHRLGAQFVVNPPRLADVDVVLALRDASGYAPRYWKSNVKLANAHGSGTPFIGCREAGYLETATGAEYWADTPAELHTALDWLMSQSTREQVADRFIANAYPVDRAAAELELFLLSI